MGWKHGGPRTSCTMEPRGAPPGPRGRGGGAHSTRYPPEQAGAGLPVSLPCDGGHGVPPTQWLKMCSLSVLEVGSLKGACWAEIKVVGWLCSS